MEPGKGFFCNDEDGARFFPFHDLDQHSLLSPLGCPYEQTSLCSDSRQLTQQSVHLSFTNTTNSKKPLWIMNQRCLLWLQKLLNCWESCQSWSYTHGEKLSLQLPKAPFHPLVSEKRHRSGIFNQYQMLLLNKKKRGKREEGTAACWKITLPTDGEMKCQMWVICIFILTEGKSKATASHVP